MKKLLNILILAITGLILGGALLLAARPGASAVPVDSRALAASNRLFESGRYVESARVLEQILAQGAPESTVFFNLGNAYYAQGDMERALENYEQAAELAPRDQDIRHNLDLTRSQLPPPAAETAPGPLTSLANLTASWVTVNETALLLLGIWFAACYLAFVSRQISRSSARSALRIAAAIGVILVVLGGASLGSRIYLDRSVSEGVDVPTVVAEYLAE